jgi:hypothetical protein
MISKQSQILNCLYIFDYRPTVSCSIKHVCDQCQHDLRQRIDGNRSAQLDNENTPEPLGGESTLCSAMRTVLTVRQPPQSLLDSIVPPYRTVHTVRRPPQSLLGSGLLERYPENQSYTSRSKPLLIPCACAVPQCLRDSKTSQL